MKAIIKVVTQYQENYNTETVDPPYWKMKGAVEFEITVDADIVIYGDERTTINAIKSLLEKQSNDMCKYTYIEHDVLYGNPHQIGELEFMAELDEAKKRAIK